MTRSLVYDQFINYLLDITQVTRTCLSVYNNTTFLKENKLY